VPLTGRLALLALLLWAAPAGAASTQLALARSQFVHGEFRKVVDTLEHELYPQAHISDEEELKEAHLLLATSYFFLDNRDKARQEFSALLFLDPGRELDPVVTNPNVYEFFTKIKDEKRQKLEEVNKIRQREAQEKNKPSREVVITRTIHETSTFSNFIPFGYGQFRNGDPGKGAFFLISELLTAGGSIGLAAYQIGTYGWPVKYSTAAEKDQIQLLRDAQLVTGGLFFLFYAIGTWDSFASRPPAVQETRTERLLTPQAPAPAPPAKSSLLLVPILAPNTAGVGAEWRF
jgi:hypothetical protein